MPIRRRLRRARHPQPTGTPWLVISQLVISLMLFALIYSFTYLPDNWSRPALDGVRASLDWEWDLVETVVSVANQGQWPLPGAEWPVFWNYRELPPAGSLAWPAGGPVVAAFGWQGARPGGQVLSDGIEISAPGGSRVRAAYAGTVAGVRMSPVYGMVIEVDHGNRLVTLYGRCDEALVAPRQRVNQGQVLAQVAHPQDGPAQLYFEVRLSGQAVDPLYWLPLEPS